MASETNKIYRSLKEGQCFLIILLEPEHMYIYTVVEYAFQAYHKTEEAGNVPLASLAHIQNNSHPPLV